MLKINKNEFIILHYSALIINIYNIDGGNNVE